MELGVELDIANFEILKDRVHPLHCEWTFWYDPPNTGFSKPGTEWKMGSQEVSLLPHNFEYL